MNKYLVLVLLLALVSCGAGTGGTTTGNPIRIEMKFASFSPSIARMISNWIIPEAHASLSSLKMCFKRVRFKPESDSAVDNVDLELGEVEIKQEGTVLSNVSIPSMVYRRVEFDLAKDCDDTTKNSVTVDNANGTFTSTDTITIKFEGEYNPADGDLTMFVQNIVDKVKNYQASDGDLGDQLESVSGTF